MYVKEFVLHCITMLSDEVIWMAKTDVIITMRATSEFKARLEAEAQKERRSVSNLILKVMEEYLDQQEKQEEQP